MTRTPFGATFAPISAIFPSITNSVVFSTFGPETGKTVAPLMKKLSLSLADKPAASMRIEQSKRILLRPPSRQSGRRSLAELFLF